MNTTKAREALKELQRHAETSGIHPDTAEDLSSLIMDALDGHDLASRTLSGNAQLEKALGGAGGVNWRTVAVQAQRALTGEVK
jgi:hypothetical protein